MKYTFICILILGSTIIQAQKYFTRTGEITFTSKAPMEAIEATNNKATSVIDLQTEAIEWAVLIKAFEFEKALMQTHFNENYMESSKMPKANFKGTILGINGIDLSREGRHDLVVQGALTIHGVTKEITTKATLTIKENQLSATSHLKVLVADYNIEIPKIVRENIAKEVDINISAHYELLKRS